MDYWHTITAMAGRATRETGKSASPDDIFNLARRGVIRLGAVIPGGCELQWFYNDGSEVSKLSVWTDGVACWLDTNQLEWLVVHDRVSLAGLRWPIPNGTTLHAGPDSPLIYRDDLRIPEPEYPRILAALNGEPEAPREPEGTAPTPPRLAVEPGAHLIQQWQDRAARIHKLLKSEADMLPSEQEAAMRVRERFEGEQRQLEAKPEFLSALNSRLSHLEANHEGIARSGQQDDIEQSVAQIEDYRAWLARLREEQTDAATQSPGEIDTTGMVGWQAVTLENWLAITEAHGTKPSARNVMSWLKKNGPEKMISKHQPNRDSLCWIDGKKNSHTLPLKTLGTRLSLWRNEGKIPR